jgi:hypothetical protein
MVGLLVAGEGHFGRWLLHALGFGYCGGLCLGGHDVFVVVFGCVGVFLLGALLLSSSDASSLPTPIVDKSRGGGGGLDDQIYKTMKNESSYLLSSLLRYIQPRGQIWLQSQRGFDENSSCCDGKMLFSDSVDVIVGEIVDVQISVVD